MYSRLRTPNLAHVAEFLLENFSTMEYCLYSTFYSLLHQVSIKLTTVTTILSTVHYKIAECKHCTKTCLFFIFYIKRKTNEICIVSGKLLHSITYLSKRKWSLKILWMELIWYCLFLNWCLACWIYVQCLYSAI